MDEDAVREARRALAEASEALLMTVKRAAVRRSFPPEVISYRLYEQAELVAYAIRDSLVSRRGQINKTTLSEIRIRVKAVIRDVMDEWEVLRRNKRLSADRRNQHDFDDFMVALTSVDVRAAELVDALERPAIPSSANVPAQKAAPVLATVTDVGKVILDNASAHTETRDSSIIAAREYLTEEAQAVLTALVNSNCDKRHLRMFEKLRDLLPETSAANVVKLGMHVYRTEAVARQIDEEVAEATSLSTATFLLSVRQFVEQFSEWQEFVRNAAAAVISAELLPPLEAVTKKFAERPEVVDQSVLETLQATADGIGAAVSHRHEAIYAMVQSVANVASAALKWLLEKARNLIDGSVDTATAAIVRVVVPVTIVAGFLQFIAPELTALSAATPLLNWFEKYLPHIDKISKLFGKKE
jgi:hypothetical protein